MRLVFLLKFVDVVKIDCFLPLPCVVVLFF